MIALLNFGMSASGTGSVPILIPYDRAFADARFSTQGIVLNALAELQFSKGGCEADRRIPVRERASSGWSPMYRS